MIDHSTIHADENNGLNPSEVSIAEVEFAVLCDSHIEHPKDVRFQYLEQAIRKLKARSRPPAFVVFLGDLASASGDDQELSHVSASGMLAHPSWRTYILRGNTDIFAAPCRFAFERNGYSFIGFDTAEGIYGDDEDQLLARALELRTCSTTILFTHFYPEALDAESRNRLRARLDSIGAATLICGHGHRAEQYTWRGTEIHLVAGTDPFKPGHDQPGAEIFSIVAGTCHRSRLNVSLVDAQAAERFHRAIGVAIEADCVDRAMLTLLQERSIVHLQIKQFAKADDAHRAMLSEAHGRVTLHASTPNIIPDGTVANQRQLDEEVAFARRKGIHAITTHLPPVNASTLFSERGELQTGPGATQLVDALAGAWAGYWKAGIRIDIENTHWYDPAEMPESFGEHQLGIHPSHLLAFREQVESTLRRRHGSLKGASVGFCLDVGHALTNGPLASKYGWTEWFESLRPHIGSIHLHDVVADALGRREGHRPIGVDRGLLNIEAIAFLAVRDCPNAPLYMEIAGVKAVNDSLNAVAQWENCRQSVMSACSCR